MSQGNACHDVSARENERLKVFKHKKKEKVKLSFKKLAKKEKDCDTFWESN